MAYNVVFIHRNGSRQIVRKNYTEEQAEEWVNFANEYIKRYSKPTLDQFLSPNNKGMYYVYEEAQTHVSKDSRR